MYVQT